MNATESHSDSEGETQATQLLYGILDSGSGRTSDTRGSGRQNLDKGTTDSPLPVPRPLPNYDFQGLAETQTQHLEHDAVAREGSHKENIGMQKGEWEAAQKPLNALHLPPASDIKTKGIKAVSFQSPRGKSGPPKPSNSSARPARSTTYPSALPNTHTMLPDSSQDSFAAVDQDPEQQFLATSKQFNVPLSELPRVLAGGQGSTHTNYGTTPKPPSDKLSNRPRRSLSPQEGNVLVASTPSVSSSSQSQLSQPRVQARPLGARTDLVNQQPDDVELDTAANPAGHISHGSVTDGYLSDAPSSNIYSNYGDHDEDDRALSTLEATQPSTQVDDDNMNIDSVHPFDVPLTIPQNGGGSFRSAATANSRNLLNAVDPKVRHRYQQYLDKPVGLPEVQHLLQSNSQPSENVEMEETQPSFEPETWMPPRRLLPTPANPTSVSLPPRDDTKTGPGQQAKLSYDVPMLVPSKDRLPYLPVPPIHRLKPHTKDFHSRQASENHIDVIPDSEPLRAEVASNVECSNPTEHLHQSHTQKEIEVAESLMAIDVKEGEPHAAVVGKSLLPVMENEEEEEDIPLAAVHPNRIGKFNKGPMTTKNQEKDTADRLHNNAVSGSSVGKQVKTASKPNARPGRASVSHTVKKLDTIRSWATGEVPSSLPDQDFEKVSQAKRPPIIKGKGKGKATSTRACRKPKTSAAIPVTRARRHIAAGSESPLSASDDEDSMRMASGNDDTELTDEEHTHRGAAGSLSKKRKRNEAHVHVKAIKVDSKTSKTASTTPSKRQTKRLRSAASTSKSGEGEPSRVFALWKQDGHYYPGTVYSYMGGVRYTIHFDDMTESVVNIDQIRLLDLRVGDDVLVPKVIRGVKIVDVAKFESSDLVSVRLDTGITEVHVQAIKIASRTISYAWKDRMMTSDAILTIVGSERAKPSPTPSRLSMLSGPSARGLRSNMFDKTALVITISSNGNWEKDKGSVMSAITNNGGEVLNDWSDVLRMEGKHSHASNRWVIHKNEVKWMGTKDIERVFLVADDSCLKPKFLIALALGVPCISVSWLRDSIDAGEEKDWQAYMLPQGHSEALDARASQQVDVDWGNSVHQLGGIMDNRVPCKLFKAKSILCVGAEMVPALKGKKLTAQDEKARDARNAVTRIILAMGADRVEAVTDVKHASVPLSSFDFVVIKEDYHYGSHLGNGTTVPWSWVKDCLIASRLLPLPDWGQPVCESQDA